MDKLNCQIIGKKRSGRCVFTRRNNVEVYCLNFNGKPITVQKNKLDDYLDFKADEMGINVYLDDDAESQLEVLNDEDVMTA